jgi:hypothetical protein
MTIREAHRAFDVFLRVISPKLRAPEKIEAMRNDFIEELFAEHLVREVVFDEDDGEIDSATLEHDDTEFEEEEDEEWTIEQ